MKCMGEGGGGVSKGAAERAPRCAIDSQNSGVRERAVLPRTTVDSDRRRARPD